MKIRVCFKTLEASDAFDLLKEIADEHYQGWELYGDPAKVSVNDGGLMRYRYTQQMFLRIPSDIPPSEKYEIVDTEETAGIGESAYDFMFLHEDAKPLS